LNILVSGAVRFLTFIFLLAGSSAVKPNYLSLVIVDAQISLGSHSITQMTMFVIGIGNDMGYIIYAIRKLHRDLNKSYFLS
jgi:hypothetical protein